MPQDKQDAILNELANEYAKLLTIRTRAQTGSLNQRLQATLQKLDDIFDLLVLWQKYVEVVYMPDSEAELYSVLNKQAIFPEEISFQEKAHNQDIQHRLKILFGKEKVPKFDEMAEQSVNEAQTTDTSEESEIDAAQSENSEPSA